MKGVYDYLIPVEEAKTIEEVAKLSGLNFSVRKEEMFYNFNNSNWGVPKNKAIIREDNGVWLGIGSDIYGIIQYLDALKFSEALVGDGDARYVAAGPLGNGELAIVVMRTADYLVLDPNNKIHCYFYLMTSHDRTKGLSVVPTPYCEAGGLVVSPPEKMKLKFKHSRHVMNHLYQAQRSIHKVQENWDKFKKAFELFRQTTLNTSQVDDYLKMVIPDPEGDGEAKRAENIRAEIDEIRLTNPACRLPSTHGTMLGAYMSVLIYGDKYTTIRKSKHFDEISAGIHSRLEGASARKKAEAYSFGLQLLSKLKGISVSGLS